MLELALQVLVDSLSEALYLYAILQAPPLCSCWSVVASSVAPRSSQCELSSNLRCGSLVVALQLGSTADFEESVCQNARNAKSDSDILNTSSAATILFGGSWQRWESRRLLICMRRNIESRCASETARVVSGFSARKQATKRVGSIDLRRSVALILIREPIDC